MASSDALRVQLIEQKGALVAKQVHRRIKEETLAAVRDWEVGWHGTKARHLASIFKHGLIPSGSTLPDGKTVRSPRGHIGMGVTYGGIVDWAQAVFVSPSLLYASHGAYAEEVMSEGKR